MRCFIGLLLIALYGSNAAWADGQHHHTLTEKEVGSVHFSNSCSPEVQVQFQRAVALLHSFEYEHARAAFEEIARQDPNCAMAEWGIAMSHYHGLWHNGDTAAGREALRKAQQVAARNTHTTRREHDYIDALAEIYKEDGRDEYAQAKAFEKKMGTLQADYPDDTEAAIFHALSLDMTAPKSDKSFANQRQCGEILEPILAKQPNHPGVAHYLIHCYDNPVLAGQGLAAARRYAAIAPDSAHANHMPSHIFTRVGSWQESIESNLKSAELARRDEASSTDSEAREKRLHAMDYLEYAYLQSGRVSDARAVVDEMNSLPPIARKLTLSGDYAIAAIPARYALELGKWDEAAQLQPVVDGVPWAQAITWMAIGVGAARSGDLHRAAEAERKLAVLREETQTKNLYWSNQIEVQRQEVSAWITEASGKHEDAIASMRSAADLEESMDKDPVTPGPIVPARELLAQLLQSANRSHESLEEYVTVLKTAPNRFNALWGAASVAESVGDPHTAATYFRKLLEVSVGTERPEVRIARAKVGIVANKY